MLPVLVDHRVAVGYFNGRASGTALTRYEVTAVGELRTEFYYPQVT